MGHEPVMVQEILEFLRSRSIRTVFDGTCGAGGHALTILNAHPEIETYVACDQDLSALAIARATLEQHMSKVVLHHANFQNPPKDPPTFDCIVLDLGVSSMQLDTPERGFSFLREGPLDMRMNPKDECSAEDIVNGWDRVSLEKLFLTYGEERGARKAVEAIVRARNKRPIRTTLELAEIISSVIPRRGRLHPATKIFQALRIAVNQELDVLKEALPMLVSRLSPQGRCLVLTFHSLEDRIVKEEFRRLAKTDRYVLVVKKPLVPTRQEMIQNPRSRSAKLRVLEGG